ncbi:hypothetical protein ACFT8W_03155 [Streptomyces hygroscopicus]|uniref:hypothetical protein n=1 Tax=Streptomyces hygroscopicus TaxID=1912 RepID=UPI003644E648
MSASHAMPALTAAAAIGIVLAARWAATHPSRSRHGASAARPPWRRTAPGPDTTPPPTPDEAARAAVKDAEEHLQRCLQQLRIHPDRSD